MNKKEYFDNIKKKVTDFVPVMDGLSRARNPFELRYFVIGKHDDRVQQYKQAVVECDAKYKAVEEAIYNRKKKEIEKARLYRKLATLTDEFDIAETELELEKIDRDDNDAKIAMTGAMKEVLDFITIIENEFSDLVEKTEEELLETEREYWESRFAKQIQIDLQTTGRIGAGNLSSLQSMPKDVQGNILRLSMIRNEEYKEFMLQEERKAKIMLSESFPRQTIFLAPPDYTVLKLRKDAPEGYPENRIVNMDRVEIMIATMHRPGDEEWCSEVFNIPAGKNYIKHWVTCNDPMMIGEWRNRIVKDALSLGCTHLFFVDDDLVVGQDALVKLYEHDLDCVGGWYPKKVPNIESATLISTPDKTSKQGVPLDTTGLVEVDWSLTGGLTLIKTDCFRKVNYPWYLTTERGTEDTFFTARLRECGIKSFLDTSIKAAHIDKETRKCYYFDGIHKNTEEWRKKQEQ